MKVFINMHSVENRLVTGPSNIQFGGVYVCNFQPGNLKVVAVKGLNTCLETIKKNILNNKQEGDFEQKQNLTVVCIFNVLFLSMVPVVLLRFASL